MRFQLHQIILIEGCDSKSIEKKYEYFCVNVLKMLRWELHFAVESWYYFCFCSDIFCCFFATSGLQNSLKFQIYVNKPKNFVSKKYLEYVVWLKSNVKLSIQTTKHKGIWKFKDVRKTRSNWRKVWKQHRSNSKTTYFVCVLCILGLYIDGIINSSCRTLF